MYSWGSSLRQEAVTYSIADFFTSSALLNGTLRTFNVDLLESDWCKFIVYLILKVNILNHLSIISVKVAMLENFMKS